MECAEWFKTPYDVLLAAGLGRPAIRIGVNSSPNDVLAPGDKLGGIPTT
jgi:biotin-(acetyl-CoA carboxylase) ligase